MSPAKTILSLLAGATLFAALPAAAQYYDPYGRPPPPPRYDYDEDYPRRPPSRDWDRPPPPRWGGYDRPRGPRFGDVCVTSRGSCGVRPSPVNSNCGCDIPGFGPKRGAVQ